MSGESCGKDFSFVVLDFGILGVGSGALVIRLFQCCERG